MFADISVTVGGTGVLVVAALLRMEIAGVETAVALAALRELSVWEQNNNLDFF